MRTVLALSALAVAAASQAIMLDDFSDGDMYQTQSAVGGNSYFDAATVPGSVRAVVLQVNSNVLGLNSTVAVTNGVFAFATDPLVNAAAGIGYGRNAGGLVPLNLDLSSESAFTVDILSNDIYADLFLSVISSTHGTHQVTHSIGTVAYGSPQTVEFAFSDFGIPMDDVDYLQLDIYGTTNNDIVLDNLQTTSVPEPATMVLGFAAITALASKRRRK